MKSYKVGICHRNECYSLMGYDTMYYGFSALKMEATGLRNTGTHLPDHSSTTQQTIALIIS